MTAEDKKIIAKYESNIITAGKSDYTRAIPKYALEQLQEIYNKTLNTKISTNFTCSKCILTFLKKFYNNIYIKCQEKKK